MEMLDLQCHDPEEYEGKTVVIDGCPYEVGKLIGSGASKFVHALRNQRSGLCLSVLAIYRDPEAGQEELKRELAAKLINDVLGFGLVLNIREVSLPGGLAYLQDYVGPFEPEPSPDLLAAQQLLVEEQWTEALSALSIVLRARPDHTVALNNTAFALAQMSEYGRAVELMADALEIEPNYLPYLRSYVEYADAAGLLAEVVGGSLMLREKYPHDHSCDQLAARVPAQAAELNNSAIDLARTGHHDEAVKAITRAVEAYRRLAADDSDTYDVELAEALINLGSFTCLAGDAVGATEPLIEAVVIAQKYGRHDLVDIAVDTVRYAWGESPTEVDAEFRRLTGDPVPGWLKDRPHPRDRRDEDAGGSAK